MSSFGSPPRQNKTAHKRLMNALSKPTRQTLSSMFRPGSSTSIDDAPDEIDDIELLEDLVHEVVEFDWDEFETAREQSLFQKKRPPAPAVRKSQFKEMVVELGSQFNESVGGNEDGDDSDVESVVLAHNLKSEQYVEQMSSDGKAKLKFVMSFARSGDKTAAKHTLRDLNAQDRFLLRNSIYHRKKSRKMSRLLKNPRASLLAGKLECEPQDCFARMKGFRSKEHMEKSLERLRGFEELKNQTQIDLMAKENGYRPDRSSRYQSVLSFLDIDNGQKAYSDSSDDEEDPKNVVGLSDSEDEDEKEVDDFMDLEEENLEELMKKWDATNFNKDSDEEDSDYDFNTHDKDSEKHSKKAKSERRKMAVRKGWTRKKNNTENEFVQRRLRPVDSLSAKQFESMRNMFFEEEEDLHADEDSDLNPDLGNKQSTLKSD